MLLEMQYYLKGRELFLMFTPQANERARALFQEAIKIDSAFYRARGHLAYANIQAWLYGWSAIDLTKGVRDCAWGALYDPLTIYPDDSKPLAGKDDYDNWWTVGGALLYYAAHGAPLAERDKIFKMSIEYYEQARIKALATPAVNEDMADLLADYADALYFRGDKGDVDEAIKKLDEAKVLSGPNYPKWHDWNRAWAHYELGQELETSDPDKSEAAYLSAINLLTSMPKLPNQWRRTLAACYVALGWDADARSEGRQFLMRERASGHPYDPAIEMRWPYKDPARSAMLRQRLRKSGLPAPV